jgi:hypothetical protein
LLRSKQELFKKGKGEVFRTGLAVKVCDAENVGGAALRGGREARADGASGELHVRLRGGEDAGDEESDGSKGLHFEWSEN